MEDKIISVIEKIRPFLQRDGGDVEFIKFEDGIVYVKMYGACVGCSSLDATLSEGLEALLLDEVPGVKAVKLIDLFDAL